MSQKFLSNKGKNNAKKSEGNFPKIRKVLVIGAGTMGRQIAQVLAQHRIKVVISDKSDIQLLEAKNFTRKNLEKRVNKKKLTEKKAERTLQHLFYVSNWEQEEFDFDLIIECVPENLELKREIFLKIAKKYNDKEIADVQKSSIAGAENKENGNILIYGTNSSTIPIEKIVYNIKDCGDLKLIKTACNIHFSNPPLRMRLVELHSATNNSPLLEHLKRFFRHIRYEPVIFRKPISGFIMNRIFGGALQQAFWLLENEICSPEEIDIACTAGLNWPLGAARLADFVGLDVILDSFQKIYQSEKQEYQKPSAYLINKVKLGKLGIKTGEGIYKY